MLIQIATKKSIVLFQPRYPYGKNQIYMPTGVLNLGARLFEASHDVAFFDLNFTGFDSSEVQEAVDGADTLGFTVLGAPYVPEVVANIRTLRQQGCQLPILIGGQGVARMRPQDFARWFANLGDVRQVRNDDDLALEFGRLPSAYATSIVPLLHQLPWSQVEAYVAREFSLFLSQGCKFSCGFCMACKGMAEEYRERRALLRDVAFFCHVLKGLGKDRLKLYLSNLDAFQTPKKLEEALAGIAGICREIGIEPEIRCLATSQCTFEACVADRNLARRLKSYGLVMVAFGADGSDEEVWTKEGKVHNSADDLAWCIKHMQHAGITVELLMVIGFPHEGIRTMAKNLWYCLLQTAQGGIPRPYLAKSVGPSGRWPGAKFRRSEEKVTDSDNRVQALLASPERLYALDFAALGSVVTHPVMWQRWASNCTYLPIIGLLAPFGKCPTSPILPQGVPGVPQWFARLWNRLVPFDR